jgi:hypothetical protein
MRVLINFLPVLLAGGGIDRDKERRTQYWRKQFPDGLPGADGHADSPLIPDGLTAKCVEAVSVGIS